jgi:signal transduction histidine kinase
VSGDPSLDTFDEWRGGSGLSLGVARRVIEAHGGRIWSPAEDAKAGAVIALPHA